MIVYPDASFLVSLFAADVMMPKARAYLFAEKPELVISDFAAAEFASAIARRVRTQELTKNEGRLVFSNFDIWSGRFGERVEFERGDLSAADAFLRRLDLTLRTPDAINIAIAQRVDATLATFDQGMGVAARRLGVAVAKL